MNIKPTPYYADLLARMLIGKKGPTFKEALEISEFICGTHPGNLSHRVATQFSDPQYIKQFVKEGSESQKMAIRWLKNLNTGYNASEQQAINFILQVFSSAEQSEQMFGSRVLSAATRSIQGTAMDLPVLRSPGRVQGWSLELTVKGQGHYRCLRQSFTTQPGDIVLLSPDAFYEHRRLESSQEWLHYWIYFHPEHRMTEWMRWPEMSSHVYRIQLHDPHYEKIKSVFESAFELQAAESTYSEHLMLNLTNEVLIRCSAELPEGTQLSIDQRVKSVMETITENLAHTHPVEELANGVGLSRMQLSSLFKKFIGCTLTAWREERRMARATQLLTESSLQVQEVAQQVGYEDPLYFSRVFSRLVGTSPRQYRDSIRNPQPYNSP